MPPPPPKPIEDIDFPAIGDKVVDLLSAIWEFICDIYLIVSANISQALSVVWSYPPFEAFRNDFVAAFVGMSDYVVAHPITSAVIALLLFIVIPGVLNALTTCLLHSLGYRRRGISYGSYTPNYQSTSHGGNVQRGPTFARFQSQSAKGGCHVGSGTGSSTRY